LLSTGFLAYLFNTHFWDINFGVGRRPETFTAVAEGRRKRVSAAIPDPTESRV
jgi:hypothetical protein